MHWNRIALFTSGVLGTILVARLLSLRLHRVYRVFCVYLAYVLLSSLLVFVEASAHHLDYRIVYLAIATGSWILTPWMVYSLLDAILAQLPGILKFSRWFLVIVFLGGIALAILSARSEYVMDRNNNGASPLEFAVILCSPMERVVTTVSLIALLAIQAFLLWFPVQLPRNLVFFSIGFVFNFVCETVLLVIRGLLPASAAAVIDPVNLFVLSACFAYFAMSINREGESIPVRIGHHWRREEQKRLLEQMENINIALLRSVRQ